MRGTTWSAVALAVLGTAAWATAGEGERDDVAEFAAPVRIKAGEELLGHGRYYPSPVLHDVDGDGTPELVVGDLRGMITMAKRTDGAVTKESPLLAADGKQLKFKNW